jgi:hypothetical protein
VNPLLALLFAAALPAISTPTERDHLQRGELPWGNDSWAVRYDKEFRRILWRAWEPDVVLRTVHFPPFHTEWIVGIIRRPSGYSAFLLEPTTQIWPTLQDPKNAIEPLAKIRPRFYERELSNASADRVAAIFRKVLSDRRNYQEDRRILTDTSSFTYMVRYLPGEHFVAFTASDDHTPSALLFDLSARLYLFVRGKVDMPDDKWLRMSPKDSQLALQQCIREAETKLGVTKRSNQAMQPTASPRTASLSDD